MICRHPQVCIHYVRIQTHTHTICMYTVCLCICISYTPYIYCQQLQLKGFGKGRRGQKRRGGVLGLKGISFSASPQYWTFKEPQRIAECLLEARPLSSFTFSIFLSLSFTQKQLLDSQEKRKDPALKSSARLHNILHECSCSFAPNTQARLGWPQTDLLLLRSFRSYVFFNKAKRVRWATEEISCRVLAKLFQQYPNIWLPQRIPLMYF